MKQEENQGESSTCPPGASVHLGGSGGLDQEHNRHVSESGRRRVF